MDEVETLVIGAGVVGLALAAALAARGREVLICEGETAFGTGISSRNSEVIHAGIYYPAGSLKARLCVEGRRLLYDWCAAHGVGARKTGKLIVAAEPAELEGLDALAAKAAANGVEGMRRLSGAEARAMEPALRAEGALLSPETGIVDSHGFMLSLLGAAEERGAMLALGAPVLSLAPQEGGFLVEVGGAEPMRLLAREVVNAAGLAAPRLAPGGSGPAMLMAKGSYFRLEGRAPFSRLIYPAPVVGGLGVHLTLDMGGQARFGPDVEWIEREDYAVDPARGESFYAAIRRYWPGLPDGALKPDYAGIRPKLAGPEAGGAADFRIDGPEAHGLPGYLGLYGIESPGLTSALAIAEEGAARLMRR
ncbi:MAG: NAD(P)/FAD-dependent oxidoreductase [Pikeienuella sp.]|uniref:NAD(P)/FAD-dependent oxidoreductase n=1 Tax=Pikeienuella sp. TaxID=2831957 RepID=UPI0039196E02